MKLEIMGWINKEIERDVSRKVRREKGYREVSDGYVGLCVNRVEKVKVGSGKVRKRR